MIDVSRATPEEDSAEALIRTFPEAADGLARYAELLRTAGTERGLLGPREVNRIWDRHLSNCAAIASLIPADSRVADVGSGAGLPGVVLALVRPDLVITLLEPLLRRATFLSDTVDSLGLGARVDVARLRAQAAPRRQFDLVTARAVAPLGGLVEICLPLLRPGGVLLALKGSRAGEELAAAQSVLAVLPIASAEVLTVAAAGSTTPTTVVRVVAA